MKRLFTHFLLWVSVSVMAQNVQHYEKPPTFSDCEETEFAQLKQCFDTQVFNLVYEKFNMPEVVKTDNYKGEMVVLFEVTSEGTFNVIYIDAVYNELKAEAKRVFANFPQVQPATYGGRPVFSQYSVPIKIPLEKQYAQAAMAESDIDKDDLTQLQAHAKTEMDSVVNSRQDYQNKEYTSQLNIPFTHAYYAGFDRSMNLVGTNSHTAQKPYLYSEVSKYHDFKAEHEDLKKDEITWLGRKFFNEHMVRVQTKDYWFTIDPMADLQVGKDTGADVNTFNNTRAVYFQGGFGDKLGFFTSVYESQGRFAQYYNRYINSIRGADGPVVPGRGLGKDFKEDAFDYPVAEAYLSFTPTKNFNIQFGHGKNFIGDGYRSLLHSDVASPHSFVKLNTNFWKLKYTNTWMWLKDLRLDVREDGAYLTKYMANHYLSLNVSKRLNVGLFESVIWTKTANRGFDINYVNPIIFYRAIEFESGQYAGNALLGLTAKYKLNDNAYVYGQFLLDEFSLEDMRAGTQSWKNKNGYQLGLKYFNAFKVKNLMLQAEYNKVRPFTYSHTNVALNYGHNNQSMAHLWSSNFSEFILIGRYRYNRWQGDASLILGTRGFDYNTEDDNLSYGNDLYKDYETRNADTGIAIGNGIKTKTINAEVRASYLINPATNLKLFASVSFRDFDPETETDAVFKNSTTWFNLGFRTELFNWYFDL